MPRAEGTGRQPAMLYDRPHSINVDENEAVPIYNDYNAKNDKSSRTERLQRKINVKKLRSSLNTIEKKLAGLWKTYENETKTTGETRSSKRSLKSSWIGPEPLNEKNVPDIDVSAIDMDGKDIVPEKDVGFITPKLPSKLPVLDKSKFDDVPKTTTEVLTKVVGLETLYGVLMEEHLGLQLCLQETTRRLRSEERRRREVELEDRKNPINLALAERIREMETEMECLRRTVQELQEENDHLEFRLLEMDEPPIKKTIYRGSEGMRYDVTDVDDVSDSGVMSLPASDDEHHDFFMEAPSEGDVKSRLLALSQSSEVSERVCLQQGLALLRHYEARIESLESTIAAMCHEATLARGLKTEEMRTTSRVIATVLPFTERKDCLQESGIFEEAEWASRGTQTEPRTGEQTGDLSTELEKLSRIREKIETGNLQQELPPLKQLSYYRERVETLEGRLALYEASPEEGTKLMRVQLEKEARLEAEVRHLRQRLAKLGAENRALEEERCELEEAENDTRLRCQKLEHKLSLLGEKKSCLKAQLAQLNREMASLKDDKKQASRMENLVKTYEKKNQELEEKEMEARYRLQMLENTMPALMMWNMWRMMMAMQPGCAPQSLPSMPGQQTLPNVAANAREEELIIKLQALEQRLNAENSQLEESRNAEEILRHKVKDMEALIETKDSNILAVLNRDNGIDVEAFEKLSKMAKDRLEMDRRIKDLELKEKMYQETLQQADSMFAQMECSYVSQIQEKDDLLFDRDARLEETEGRLRQTAGLTESNMVLQEKLIQLEIEMNQIKENLKRRGMERECLEKEEQRLNLELQECSRELQKMKDNIEGPLKGQLEVQKKRASTLSKELERVESEKAEMEERHIKEVSMQEKREEELLTSLKIPSPTSPDKSSRKSSRRSGDESPRRAEDRSPRPTEELSPDMSKGGSPRTSGDLSPEIIEELPPLETIDEIHSETNVMSSTKPPRSPRVSETRKISGARSPKVSGDHSPRISNTVRLSYRSPKVSRSPPVHGSDSPTVSGSRSPRVSRSPPVQGSNLPTVSGSRSPRVSRSSKVSRSPRVSRSPKVSLTPSPRLSESHSPEPPETRFPIDSFKGTLKTSITRSPRLSGSQVPKVQETFSPKATEIHTSKDVPGSRKFSDRYTAKTTETPKDSDPRSPRDATKVRRLSETKSPEDGSGARKVSGGPSPKDDSGIRRRTDTQSPKDDSGARRLSDKHSPKEASGARKVSDSQSPKDGSGTRRRSDIQSPKHDSVARRISDRHSPNDDLEIRRLSVTHSPIDGSGARKVSGGPSPKDDSGTRRRSNTQSPKDDLGARRLSEKHSPKDNLGARILSEKHFLKDDSGARRLSDRHSPKDGSGVRKVSGSQSPKDDSGAHRLSDKHFPKDGSGARRRSDTQSPKDGSGARRLSETHSPEDDLEARILSKKHSPKDDLGVRRLSETHSPKDDSGARKLSKKHSPKDDLGARKLSEKHSPKYDLGARRLSDTLTPKEDLVFRRLSETHSPKDGLGVRRLSDKHSPKDGSGARKVSGSQSPKDDSGARKRSDTQSPKDGSGAPRLSETHSPEDDLGARILSKKHSPKDDLGVRRLSETHSPKDDLGARKLSEKPSPKDDLVFRRLSETPSPKDDLGIRRLSEKHSPKDDLEVRRLSDTLTPKDDLGVLRLSDTFSPKDDLGVGRLSEKHYPKDDLVVRRLSDTLTPKDDLGFRRLSETHSPEDNLGVRKLSDTFSPKDDLVGRLSDTLSPEADLRARRLSDTRSPQDDLEARRVSDVHSETEVAYSPNVYPERADKGFSQDGRERYATYSKRAAEKASLPPGYASVTSLPPSLLCDSQCQLNTVMKMGVSSLKGRVTHLCRDLMESDVTIGELREEVQTLETTINEVRYISSMEKMEFEELRKSYEARLEEKEREVEELRQSMKMKPPEKTKSLKEELEELRSERSEMASAIVTGGLHQEIVAEIAVAKGEFRRSLEEEDPNLRLSSSRDRFSYTSLGRVPEIIEEDVGSFLMKRHLVDSPSTEARCCSPEDSLMLKTKTAQEIRLLIEEIERGEPLLDIESTKGILTDLPLHATCLPPDCQVAHNAVTNSSGKDIKGTVENLNRAFQHSKTCKKCSDILGSFLQDLIRELGVKLPSVEPFRDKEPAYAGAPSDVKTAEIGAGTVGFNAAEAERGYRVKPTVSTLALTVEQLEEKCRVKDSMIQAMADELRHLQRCNTWEGPGELLKTVADRDVPTAKVDFDRRTLCNYLNDEPIHSLTTPDEDEDREFKATNPLGLRVMRQVGPDSLLIQWQSPPPGTVHSYEIFINGMYVQRIRSPGRTKALLHPVDLSYKIYITLNAVSYTGQTCEGVTIPYP